MVKERKFFFTIFAMMIALTATLFLCLKTDGKNVVFAEETAIGEPTVTARYFTGVNGKDAVYETTAYDDAKGYASSVTVSVRIDAPYYKTEYVIDGEEYTFDYVLETPASGIVTFTPSVSGRYDVVFYAYGDFSATEPLGTKEVSFKCDSDAPIIDGKLSDGMERFVRTGDDGFFEVDWTKVSDERSGLYGVCYYYVYENDLRSDVYTLDAQKTALEKNGFTVREKCRFVAICYDNAGNGSSYEIDLNKFDDVAPPIPTYTVTPEIVNGKFARSYEIKVTFIEEETGSGLDKTQFYRVNGKTERFEATPPTPETIILNKQADYTIELYAVDKAGNRSLYETINIPFSAFDVTPPDISGEDVSFDLTSKDGVCELKVNVSDRGESGVKSVEIEGKDITLRPSATNSAVYSVKFDCFGFENALKIVATDNVGNRNTYTVPLSYFSNAAISTAIGKLTEELRQMDESEYTASLLKEIKGAADKLEYLLVSDNTSESDVASAASVLSGLLKKTVEFDYVIESKPDFASANAILEKASGFEGEKKGTVITVTLKKDVGDEGKYVLSSGFQKAFTDFFALELGKNGAAVSGSVGGDVSVGMNMPVGYYERDIALFDMESGEKVETEVKNNVIYFKMNKSTRYALVIEGGKAPKTSGNASQKTDTITVFGNTLKKTTFFMIIGIAGGVAVLAIVAFVVIMKVRR